MQLRHEPVVPDPDAAGAADARPHASTRRPRACAGAPTSWPTRAGGKPDVLLLGTGSEVALCVDAYEQLKAEGIKAAVVSMPSWEMFEHQDQAVPRRGAAPDGDRPRGGRAGLDLRLGALRRPDGAIIGMQTFGASAPLKELQKKFGFTVDAVVSAARQTLAGTA